MIFATTNAEIEPRLWVSAILALIFLAILGKTTWHGCSIGPIRCIAPLAASVAAGTLAWFFGSNLGFFIFAGTAIPWILRGISGMLVLGAVVWLVVFAILWARGRKQTNKETGENERPISGAFVGCWLGIFCIAAMVLVIDAAGTFGSTILRSRGRHSNSWVIRGAKVAICTQKSLGKIPGFAKISEFDPMPADFKDTLEKLVFIASKPAKLRRLMLADEVQAVLTLPSVYPIFNSPQVEAQIASGDIDGLLLNPQITAVLDDPEFQEAIKEIDYHSLLDELVK